MARGYYKKRYYRRGYRNYKKRGLFIRGTIGQRQRKALKAVYATLRANRKAYKAMDTAARKAQQQSARDTPAGEYALTGYGDYSWGSTAPSLGARLGAWVGDKAQSWLGTVTGLGDYDVQMNSLVQDPPAVRNNSARTVTLSHREYICDIYSSKTAGQFEIQNFPLNPGNPTTFPWLSQVAAQFQEYRLDGMIFQFKSMSADALNSTNTALGSVMMATNYNVNQPLFDSKYEMENTQFSTSVKPSMSAMHPIECARGESVLNVLYVAPGGNIPDGAAPSQYTFGNFQIATTGFQAANVNIGELWVTYEVTLMKPILTDINGTGSLWTARLTAPAVTGTVLNPSPQNDKVAYFLEAANRPAEYQIPWQATPEYDSMRAEFTTDGFLYWKTGEAEGLSGFPKNTMFRVIFTEEYTGSEPVFEAPSATPAVDAFFNCSLVQYAQASPFPGNGIVRSEAGSKRMWLSFVVRTDDTLNPDRDYIGVGLALNEQVYGTSAVKLIPARQIIIEQIREDTYDELTANNVTRPMPN